jgi:hypothetical protein
MIQQKNLNNKLQRALDNDEGNINGPLMNNEILNYDIIVYVQTHECKLNVLMKITRTIVDQTRINNKYAMKYF